MDASRDGDRLTVVVHNIGARPSGPFAVVVKNAARREIARRTHAGLDGIEDLTEKRAAFVFEGVPRTALTVVVSGPAKEITEVNNTCRLPFRRTP